MKHIKTLYDWRDIKGYEGLYQVNQFGQVKSLKRKWASGKILTPVNSARGYNQVSLYKDKKPKAFLVHRLVAEAFIPNPDNFDTVDHIDHNKKNNNVLNLQWLSRSDNSKRPKLKKG